MGSVINRKPKKDSLSYTTSLPNYRRKKTPSETSVALPMKDTSSNEKEAMISSQIRKISSHMRKKSASESSAAERKKKKKISFSGADVMKNLISENEKWNDGGKGFHNVYSPLPF